MNTTTVLVTGGAGFIGSHCCKALFRAGVTPVVIDNLSNGFKDAVKWGPFYQSDISDEAAVGKIIQKYNPVACLHFAAFIEVGEASKNPLKYYENNVINSFRFIKALRDNKVDKVVFSSTAALYGNPKMPLISEDHPKNPLNAYGKGKLVVENLLQDLSQNNELNYVALRYFNAAGADSEGELGENHTPETHLIPLACQALLGERNPLTVFGQDYPTSDGTCVRDYIHVEDLAQAHIKALKYLLEGGKSDVFNLGNGRGFSILEVIKAVSKVAGKAVPYTMGERREGDPERLVADPDKARSILGWDAQSTALEKIVKDAYTWFEKNKKL